MSGVMEGRMDGSGGEGRSGRPAAPAGRREGGGEVRWSARRKKEVVLRLLRGESLDALARETGQAAGTISAWREAFLEAGQEGLKCRPPGRSSAATTPAQRRSSGSQHRARIPVNTRWN